MSLDQNHRTLRRHSLLIFALALMLGALVGLFGTSAPVWADEEGYKSQGVVEARPDSGDEGEWTVGGQVFSVSERTIIEPKAGPLGVGACAQVYYITVDDQSMAIKIRSIPVDHCDEEGDDSGTCDDEGDDDEGGECEGNDDEGGDDENENPGHGDIVRTYGKLNSMPEEGRLGAWLIDGEAYEVTAQTELEADHGPFEPGACLKVKYWDTETVRIAKEIETERRYVCGADDDEGDPEDGDPGEGEPEDGDPEDGDSRFEARLYGVIISFPGELVGEWNIGGLTILADKSTEFEQERLPFDENVMVEVKFYTDEAGVHYALEIESKFAIENPGDDHDHSGSYEGREGHAYGLIEAWPANSSAGPIGRWQIGGVSYLAMPETRFAQRRQTFAIGAEVRVKYRIDADGRRIARVIRSTGYVADAEELSKSTLVSYVEAMPESGFDGTWQVGNVTLNTNDESRFSERHGLLAVGAFVEVEYVTDRSTDEVINYIVKMETRIPSGIGGHNHRGRIKHMGDRDIAAAGATSDEIWTIGGEQVRIVSATDLDETEIELDIDVLVEVNTYTGEDGIEVATRVQGLAETNKIFLPLTMN